MRKHVDEHDPHAGVYKTLANIFISFLGAGILTLPYAFAQSGLILGGLFLILLAVLAYYCIMLLVDCKKLLEHKGVVCISLQKPISAAARKCMPNGTLLNAVAV
jgi:amino acid permease